MRKKYGAAALALVLLLSLVAGLAQAATITIGANTYTMITELSPASISVEVNGDTKVYSASELPILVPSYESAEFSIACDVTMNNGPSPNFQATMNISCSPGRMSLVHWNSRIIRLPI